MKAVLLVLVLAVTAQTHLTVTIFGAPVVVPVLWLVTAAVVLALAALVLWLLHGAVRDGGWLRLRPVLVNP